ncbi:hypothetical protein D3C77_784610 [compost metagenome]
MGVDKTRQDDGVFALNDRRAGSGCRAGGGDAAVLDQHVRGGAAHGAHILEQQIGHGDVLKNSN